MTLYIIRRVLYMIPVTIVLSFICFLVIDAAPGDFVSSLESDIRSNLNLSEAAKKVQLEYVGELRAVYGAG